MNKKLMIWLIIVLIMVIVWVVVFMMKWDDTIKIQGNNQVNSPEVQTNSWTELQTSWKLIEDRWDSKVYDLWGGGR